MYKILIVDDESIEREGISFLIENINSRWRSHRQPTGKRRLNICEPTPSTFYLRM